MIKLQLSTQKIEDYITFIKIKQLPKYRIAGDYAEFPDEYASLIGVSAADQVSAKYKPLAGLFDYQRDIAAMAIHAKKFAVFADCGLGKTLIELEVARHASQFGKVLIVTPLMVVNQIVAEAAKFYGESLKLQRVRARDLSSWMASPEDRIGVTNYDAINADTPAAPLAGLILDESSMLKSHYGHWAQHCIRLGKGVKYKLCATGTPAPNDRIEYANHAVFLDQFPNVNSFLARFFVNRGQTQERWVLKPHAMRPFYLALSHWSIFLANPASYGWTMDTSSLPPIKVHIHDVPLTSEQSEAVMDTTGTLFGSGAGGIVGRGKLAQIAKGGSKGNEVEANKPAFIRDLIAGWPDESTIIWCKYNAEQDRLCSVMPEAASISGDTPEDERQGIIDAFKSERIKTLISKPKILGFGLNLQVATRQVFSGLHDSYEEYYQAVKRSNRVGSTKPLNVHIPITSIEAPMVENVLRKAGLVQQDTTEQERIFKETYNERRLHHSS